MSLMTISRHEQPRTEAGITRHITEIIVDEHVGIGTRHSVDTRWDIPGVPGVTRPLPHSPPTQGGAPVTLPHSIVIPGHIRESHQSAGPTVSGTLAARLLYMSQSPMKSLFQGFFCSSGWEGLAG